MKLVCLVVISHNRNVRLRLNSSGSFAPPIARIPQESGQSWGLSIGLLLRDICQFSCISIGLLIFLVAGVVGRRICLIVIPVKSCRLRRLL